MKIVDESILFFSRVSLSIFCSEPCFGSNTPLPTNLYPLITSLRIVCGQDHKGSQLGRRKIFVVFIPLSLFLIGAKFLNEALHAAN